MIRLLETYTDKLEKGDIIKFRFPYAFYSGNKLKSIQKRPGKKHYALVMGPSDPILSKKFLGDDFIELTHGTTSSPSLPFVAPDSFIIPDQSKDEVVNMFSTYPTSVPNTYNNKLTVASIHKDAPIKNTADFEYIGRVTPDVYNDFIQLYRQNKKRLRHLVIDKKSNVFAIDPKTSLLTNGKETKKRKELAEALNEAIYYPKNYYQILILS